MLVSTQGDDGADRSCKVSTGKVAGMGRLTIFAVYLFDARTHAEDDVGSHQARRAHLRHANTKQDEIRPDRSREKRREPKIGEDSKTLGADHRRMTNGLRLSRGESSLYLIGLDGDDWNGGQPSEKVELDDTLDAVVGELEGGKARGKGEC